MPRAVPQRFEPTGQLRVGVGARAVGKAIWRRAARRQIADIATGPRYQTRINAMLRSYVEQVAEPARPERRTSSRR